MNTIHTIEEVILTDHSKERTGNQDNQHPSEADIPESVLKSVVKNKKGILYYDTKTDAYHLVYNKNVIVFDYNKETKQAVIITCYRIDNDKRYRRNRWQPLN